MPCTFLPARRGAPEARVARTLALAMLAVGTMSDASGAQTLEGVSIHGFLSQGYMASQDYDYLAASSDGTFQFSEMGINFSSDVGDNLRIGTQIFARDLGNLGNNSIELDWAFGDYHWQDWLGFRAGKIKMPYGFYNETRDVDALRTSVLMPQGVYDQRYRDLMVAITGAEVYGSTPCRSWGSLDYQLIGGSTNMSPDGPVGQALNGSGAFTVREIRVDRCVGGALTWNTPGVPLRFGSTYSHVRWGADYALTDATLTFLAPMGAQPIETMESTNTRLLTSSAELSWGNVVLAAEHALWLGDLKNPYFAAEMNQESWYALASCRVADWLEAGTYYSVSYPDRDDRDGRKFARDNPGLPAYQMYQRDLTTSLRFDLNDFWMVKAEGHFIQGTGSLLAADQRTAGGKNWILFAAKTSFIF